MENIIESTQGAIKVVTFNKPSKKNATDSTMYLRMKEIFDNAANDNDVSVMVITGMGDFYSSGNDLSGLIHDSLDPRLNTLNALKDYIKAFITFPKLLVAIVNGPAIGIAATTLALCDLVFAAEKSYIYTPFTKLGIVAEGCSTFTFPRLIGDRKAAEMLYCCHKMSANEALECGMVNYIYKPEELQSKVWDKIEEVSQLPKHSLNATKKLLRGAVQDELLKANDKEIEEINNIWLSGLSAFNKKSKL